MIFVDDEPYTKPVFETYMPETKYFRQFARADTDVFCFAIGVSSHEEATEPAHGTDVLVG